MSGGSITSYCSTVHTCLGYVQHCVQLGGGGVREGKTLLQRLADQGRGRGRGCVVI